MLSILKSTVACGIIDLAKYGGNFLSTIANAGLTSPYDEQTYVKLQKLAEA